MKFWSLYRNPILHNPNFEENRKLISKEGYQRQVIGYYPREKMGIV